MSELKSHWKLPLSLVVPDGPSAKLRSAPMLRENLYSAKQWNVCLNYVDRHGDVCAIGQRDTNVQNAYDFPLYVPEMESQG